MPEVITITFKDAGPHYYFDPQDVECKPGDWVIVDTSRGTAMGKVISLPIEVPERNIEGPLKSVQRKAEEEEIHQYTQLQAQETEVLVKCGELVAKHEIGMKLVAAEYNFDGKHLTVYFTAEGKVDFRALLKRWEPALRPVLNCGKLVHGMRPNY